MANNNKKNQIYSLETIIVTKSLKVFYFKLLVAMTMSMYTKNSRLRHVFVLTKTIKCNTNFQKTRLFNQLSMRLNAFSTFFV